MKKIKNFSAFFENQNPYSGESIIIIKPELDGAYPYLNMGWNSYETGQDLEEDLRDDEDFWQMILDHPEGPLLGMNGWKQIDYMLEEYYSGGGKNKEEYIDDLQGFLDLYDIDYQAEDVIDFPDIIKKIKRVYLEKQEKDFRATYNIGNAWHFIVVLPGLSQDITTSYREIDEEMTFDKISSLTKEDNIYIFAYQKNDPNFYRVLRGEEFVEMDVMVSEVEDVIKDLFIKTEGPEDSQFMSKIPLTLAKRIYDLKGWDQKDLGSLRNLGDLGFF